MGNPQVRFSHTVPKPAEPIPMAGITHHDPSFAQYGTKPAVLLVPTGSYSAATRETSRKRRARQLTCTVRFVRLFDRGRGALTVYSCTSHARTCLSSYLLCSYLPCSYLLLLVPAPTRTCLYLLKLVPASARTCSSSYLPGLVPACDCTCSPSYLLELVPACIRTGPRSYLLKLVLAQKWSWWSLSLVATAAPALVYAVGPHARVLALARMRPHSSIQLPPLVRAALALVLLFWLCHLYSTN